MITGFHTLIYSTDAAATRAFFRDVLEWPWLDAHDGWLIFKTPPTELGVHPTSEDPSDDWSSAPHHQLSLMCDDIESTIADLRAKGVHINGGVEDQGFGLVTMIDVPGAGQLQLYEPRHQLAYELDG